MESLVALVGLVVLAIPISIIVLFVGQSRLRKRVAELEQQIATQPARGAADPIAKAPDLPEAQRRPEPKDPAPRPAPWAAAKARPEDERSEQPPAAPVQDDPTPPAAVVFREERFAALGAWLRENWFYAVSALSLALAGIFLVQYGVENGFLPPTARVLAALAFGASLIGAGEVVRRRFGDDESSATAYLPSVFSGAGLVTLFGGVLAARQLYGLIGPQGALAGMIAIAIAGLVLGWFHGPLLAAIGLIGAFAAPFVVGGASDDPSWLYGYFTVIAVLGLGIDTVRRWAWISVLTLIGAYGGAVLLVLSSPSTEPAYLAFATVLAVLTIAIPVRQVWPRHGGTMVLQALRRGKGDPWPEFPTRLAFAACAVSSAILSLHWADSPTEFWLVVVLFLALILGLIVWARDALALQDVVLFPALGFVWFVFLHGYDGGSLVRAFAATYAETNEADFPVAVTGLLALATLVSILSAWRALRGGQNAIAWAVGAALYAPAIAIALEIGWRPAQVIGAYPWALHAVALAAIMVWMAERFARVDRENRLRPALATLSALSCLTFACVIVLSSAALTVALVGMVVISALLDRRFNLPPMSWFIWAGVFSITVRLVMDPGLDWANTAPVLEMTGVYGAATLGFVIAWRVLAPLERPIAILLLESAAWATGGILLSLLLLRWLEGFGEGGADQSHWGLGLLSVIWLLLAFAQVQRFALGGRLNPLRMALAVFFAGHGLVYLGMALGDGNPLLSRYADPVLGPAVLNTLVVAYLLPALAIGFSAWRIRPMPERVRQVSYGVACAIGAVWLGLMIRHVWQGASGMYKGNGVTQPELYTYTLVLLLIGALLFYQSLARHSDLMRKAGLAVIGLAVAKVFLIDISGLGGLIRVFSLLALGLALAGLAWLNRWAKLRHSPHGPEPLDH